MNIAMEFWISLITLYAHARNEKNVYIFNLVPFTGGFLQLHLFLGGHKENVACVSCLPAKTKRKKY